MRAFECLGETAGKEERRDGHVVDALGPRREEVRDLVGPHLALPSLAGGFVPLTANERETMRVERRGGRRVEGLFGETEQEGGLDVGRRPGVGVGLRHGEGGE